MKTGLKVIKNTSVLFLGRLIAMSLGVVYVAVLSRYIHAEGMGIIVTATSLVSITSIMINFGLDNLAVREVAIDNTRAAIFAPNLFFLRSVLALAFLVTIFVITKFTQYPADTIVIIYIYGIAYIFDGLTEICISIFNGLESMEYSAVLQIGRDFINMCLSLAAIAFQASLFMLVGISALANLLKLIASLGILHWKFTRPLIKLDLKLINHLALLALPFAALTIISTVSNQVDTFVLSLYRPAQEVGWYGSAKILVNYVLLLPTLLLQSVFPVFSKFSSSRENLQLSYVTTFKYLLILGAGLCIGMQVVADPVVALIFGPGFEETAIALRILALVLFWMFGYANGYLLLAIGEQKLATMLSGAAMCITIIVSLILIPHFGLIGSSLANIVPGAIFFIPLTWICHNKLGLRVPYLLAFKSVVAAIIMAGAVFMALQNYLPLLVTILIFAPAVYIFALLGTGVIGRNDFQLISQILPWKSSRKRNDEEPTSILKDESNLPTEIH